MLNVIQQKGTLIIVDNQQTKILKMLGILGLLCLAVALLTHIFQSNSVTLQDYADQNPEIAYKESEETEQPPSSSENSSGNPATASSESQTSSPSTPETMSGSPADEPSSSLLAGASLNGSIPEDQRVLYTEGFYYEPLSEHLRRYITGISYPDVSAGSGTSAAEAAADEASDEIASDSNSSNGGGSGIPAQEPLAITYDELRYVHIWHYDFEGNPTEGELICNQEIAQDLVEIFYELYRNEYQLEQVLLIEEYNGDDTASMEANNTSCFNYRLVDGSTSLSKHAYGLAIDVNPLYNPYITYNRDGTQQVSPVSAQPYADRTASFPYKIDQDDLCYRLFTEHGFTWGGNWNSSKDYQHFQKVLPK